MRYSFSCGPRPARLSSTMNRRNRLIRSACENEPLARILPRYSRTMTAVVIGDSWAETVEWLQHHRTSEPLNLHATANKSPCLTNLGAKLEESQGISKRGAGLLPGTAVSRLSQCS